MGEGSVLITGGAGFIGSTLADRFLAEGREVVVVDDLSTGKLANLAYARGDPGGEFEFHRLDITRGALDQVVEKHRPEVICHLAAQMNVRRSVEDPEHDATVNVLGTIHVLEAARRHGTRKVVFATSGGTIYGEPDESELPLDENRELLAHSPYGASKIAGEQYLRTYAHLYGIQWTSLALTNVYGPRQDPAGEAGVVAIFTERMLSGEPAVIYGDGEQTRDFVYVDDVVHAFALALDRGDGERFNIGTGERTSVLALWQALARATGHELDPVHAPERPGELRHNAVDCRRAARVLGWKPWTSLEEGLGAALRAN
ncbi:MAG: NAD-dependent epimerase/dehydratase family protein [Nitriliruptorales bacterium]